MNIAEADRLRSREKAFHHNNDESITVDDLWESWFDSEERNWSVEQAVDWLVNGVMLPQYAENFHKNGVDGQTLPRSASFLHQITFIQSLRTAANQSCAHSPRV
jgi:hypothetical protein